MPLVTAQHIAFKEIGRFAGATSYIHVAVHLNLHNLENLLDTNASQIKEVRRQIAQYNLSSLQVNGYKPTDVLQDLIQQHKEAQIRFSTSLK